MNQSTESYVPVDWAIDYMSFVSCCVFPRRGVCSTWVGGTSQTMANAMTGVEMGMGIGMGPGMETRTTRRVDSNPASWIQSVAPSFRSFSRLNCTSFARKEARRHSESRTTLASRSVRCLESSRSPALASSSPFSFPFSFSQCDVTTRKQHKHSQNAHVDAIPPRSLGVCKSTADDSASVLTDVLLSSEKQGLVSFITEGPLLKKIGIQPNEVLEGIDEWIRFGELLCEQLSFDILNLNESQKRRIYHYYIPVFLWCRKQLIFFRDSFSTKNEGSIPALVIGISAPQGCGKTTVVESLEYLFHKSGISAASVSIDDFYLTFKEQSELASQNQGNKLLELRGNAGTHELALGIQTIQSLKQWSESTASVKLPRYNKSANSGKGDRFDVSDWPTVSKPAQVVLFEGWMLGFEPIADDQVLSINPQLLEVNQKLADYEAWHNMVDSWIVIQVDDPNWVYKWRLQAEVQMRAKGKPGMTDEQVADFVSRYMPAYQAYLPGLYKKGPKSAKSPSLLTLRIDQNRNPVA